MVLHLTPENVWLLLGMLGFTILVVALDVFISCAIYRELLRQGRAQPRQEQQQDAYAARVQRLTLRLDDAVGKRWSMSVRPRMRGSDDGERA